jgi:hypothetical protein
MVVPEETDPLRLIAAGAGVHLVVSLGWGLVLSRVLPARAPVAAAAIAGLAIAGLDLGIIGRRFPRVAALSLGPQVADHVAFGVVAGAVVARRRARR